MEEDSASDKDCDEYAAAESEDEIVFETIPQCPMANLARNKSRQGLVPDALIFSDSEDKLPRLQLNKHTHIIQVQVDIPSIFDETRISTRVLPARSLMLASEALATVDKNAHSVLVVVACNLLALDSIQIPFGAECICTLLHPRKLKINSDLQKRTQCHSRKRVIA